MCTLILLCGILMTGENKGFFFFPVQMNILGTVVGVLTRNYLLSRKLFAGAGVPLVQTRRWGLLRCGKTSGDAP